MIGKGDLSSTKELSQLILRPEEAPKAGERELYYVPVTLEDEDCQVVAGQDQKITVTAEGGAEIVGFGSGDPKPKYNYNEGVTETFGGRALVILKKTTGGSVTVAVETENGLKGEVTIAL